MKANFMDKGGKWCDKKDDVPEEVTLTENFTLMGTCTEIFSDIESASDKMF